MIRVLITLTFETFWRLVRDKIFLPALTMGVLLIAFASLASDWGIEEFEKILYDFGTFGFHVIGIIVALIWGGKTVFDSRGEGSIETQLVTPISRTNWLMGKFLGTALSLVAISLTLMVFWAGIKLFSGLKFNKLDLVIFGFLTVEWIVLCTITIFFSSFTSYAVAIFGSFSLWILGLVSSPILNSIVETNTNKSTIYLLTFLADYWDFHRFNFAGYIGAGGVSASFPSMHEIITRFGYGFFLIVFFLVLASIIFEKRKDIL
ncbi:MAG: ABC transporter permease subunit [Oligoflexales bacterium]|nr:ABC transporter permease subunit [Oligoflexales bacterium]